MRSTENCDKKQVDVKKIGAWTILITICIGLYGEARMQVKANTISSFENKKEIEKQAVHQTYNAQIFTEIKTELVKINKKLDDMR